LICINFMDSGELHLARMFCFSGRAWAALVACIVALVGSSSIIAAPQQVPAVSAYPLSAEQLDQLVAPIALYPDPLVAQILAAATYPLEIVEADRWLRIPANAELKGDALMAALQKQSWDPSIKSLVPFPQLLHMMDANLEWTEQLGDAFLAQQADIMDAVQRLRQRAQAAGSLASTPQQTVSTEDQQIIIEPANPDIVYVPAYNPWCVYGAWPYADYPPFYFESWAGYCAPADYLIAFGAGFFPFGFWAWGHLEWRHHHIRIDHDRFQHFHNVHEPLSGIWQHDPAHRHGVLYRDPATAARFLGSTGTARGYRGFTPAPTVTPSVRPAAPPLGHGPAYPAPNLVAPEHSVPPAFQSYGRGSQVRGESSRGFSSRMTLPAPAPSFHAAPMPSFHAAPMPSSPGGGGGFHGGGGGGRR
jgi:hypothetical protein